MINKKLSNIVGTHNLKIPPKGESNETINTLNYPKKIKGVIYPQDSTQIHQILALAKKHKLKLYPVSTGQNWGYGCHTPNVSSCYILHLSKLNKIKTIDAKLGIFEIEPGVTQKMLFEHLRKKKLNFMIPTTGAGPSCSLIGNALERGFGLTPESDHFSGLTSLEAILSTGDIYRSAFTAHQVEKLTPYFRNPIGPHIMGLFAQSNFGIISKATIHLSKRPKNPTLFIISSNKKNDFKQITTNIQCLLQDCPGTLSTIQILNRQRFFETSKMNQTPGSSYIQSKLTEIFIDKNIEWVIIGGIYGHPSISKAMQKLIKNKFKPLSTKITYFSENKIMLLNNILKTIPFMKDSPFLKAQMKNLQGLHHILFGTPSEVGLKLAYKNDKPPSKNLNPNRDKQGIRWLAPLIPMNPKEAIKFYKILEDISDKHNKLPSLTMTTIAKTCFDATIPILYDKNDPKNQANAESYYWALFNAFKKAGFYPYRLDIETQNKEIKKHPKYWQTVKKIKDAFDPDNIISPGRYNQI